MSGTTAQDGFIYQANVAVFLTLEKIRNGQKIKLVKLEVRKPSTDRRKNDFIVDVIIECEAGNDNAHVDIIEVKGGNVTLKNLSLIVNNLHECKDRLYPSTDSSLFLVTRQCSQNILDNNADFDVRVIVDSIVREDDTNSSLEENSKVCIAKILEKMNSDFPASLQYRILFSLQHLFMLEIRRLAQDLKVNVSRDTESADISLEKILKHNDSFVDAVTSYFGKRDKNEAYKYLNDVVFEEGVLPSPSPSPSPGPPEDDNEFYTVEIGGGNNG